MGILSFLAPKKGHANSQADVNSVPPSVQANASARDFQGKTMDVDSYLASDEAEWLKYLRSAIRTYRKPGVSMEDERRLWLTARARGRAESSAYEISA